MEVKIRKTLQTILALVVAVRLVFPLVIIAQTVEENNSGSTNTVTENVSSTQTTNQTNQADIGKSVNVSLNTGGNTVSSSTGNSTINTGDTSFSTSVETAANTSVVDSGCCAEATPDPTKISDNNSDSTNTINTTSETTTVVDIDQNATITNKINATLSTGGNSISDSTGNSTITTGDVKVKGEINNGPINYADVTLGGSGTNVSTVITSNNSGSTNIIYNSFKNYSDINVNNSAKVKNLLSFLLDSGNNSIENNIGSAKISTGDIFFVFKINNAINVSKITYACCGDSCPDPVALHTLRHQPVQLVAHRQRPQQIIMTTTMTMVEAEDLLKKELRQWCWVQPEVLWKICFMYFLHWEVF